MKSSYVLGFILSLSLVPSLPIVHAAGSPNVFLSEINWAGSSKSTADEWIELSNSGGTLTDIGGWQLTGVGTSETNLVIPANTLLDAGQSYLIANYALSDPKTTLTVAPNLVTTAVSIPNSSLKITVLDAFGNVIDALTDPGSPDFGSSLTFTSMERDHSSLLWRDATTSLNLDETQFGTPGIPTSVPTILEASIIASPPAIVPIIEIPVVALPPVEEIPIIQDPIIDTPPTTDSSTSSIINPAIEPAPASTIEVPISITPIMNEPATAIIIPTEASTDIPVEIPIIQASEVEAPIPILIDAPTSTPTIDIPMIEPEASVLESPSVSLSIGESITPTNPAIEPPSIEATQIIQTPTEISEIIPDPVSSTALTETATVATAFSLPTTTPIPTGALIISELLSSPSTGADEWVELKNTTDSSLSLDGLMLVDASGKATTLTGSIDANGFALIANPSGKLNNDGDSITLTNLDESILDFVSYGTNSNPVPKKDESLALIDGSWIITSSTPGLTNIALPIATIEPIVTDISSSITDSSTLNPTLSPILYANASTDTLETTTHTNTANTDQIHAPTRSISIGTTHVATGAQTVATIYPTPKSPTSVTLKASSTATKTSTAKTSTAKKNATKKSTAISAQSITLDDVATLADETKVIIKGTIVTTPGLIGKRSFFIDGLEIYQGTGVLADIHIGDEVKITGTLSVLSDHRRINIAEGGITVLNHIEPIVHDYSSTLPFGSLVRITGTVSARDGDGILLKTDGATIKIISATGIIIDWASLAGTNITAIGILKHGNQETITLRTATDLVKNASTEPVSSTIIAGTTGSSSGFSSFWTLSVFLSLASAGFGVWVWFTRPKLTKSLFTLHPKTI